MFTSLSMHVLSANPTNFLLLKFFIIRYPQVAVLMMEDILLTLYVHLHLLLLSSYLIAATVSFVKQTYSINEADGNIQPVLVLSNPSSTAVIVKVLGTDGSATGKQLVSYSTVLQIVYYYVPQEQITVQEHLLLSLKLKQCMLHLMLQY